MPAAVDFDYTLAFITGLMGSGHCIGMCGALVSGYFLRFSKHAEGPLPYIVYHFGRISVYSLAGFLSAFIGATLISTGLIGTTQGVLQLIAGSIMVLLGLEILGVLRLNTSFLGLPASVSKKWFMSATRRGPVIGSLMAGTLNGMMPCTLTFAMAVKATTADNPIEGGALLLVFGLGTLPMMASVGAIGALIGQQCQAWMAKLSALAVMSLGAWTLYEGWIFYDIMRGLAG